MSEWTKADEIYQTGLDLAKEERAFQRQLLTQVSALKPVEFGQLVQLLREKEEQIAKGAAYAKELVAERDLMRRRWLEVGDERNKAQGLQDIARYGLMWAVELAKKLIDTTSSQSEHEACKAILQAWEELKIHDQGPAAACPPAVGHAPVRHGADCQNERPAGVAGREFPGPAEGEDRTASSVILKTSGQHITGAWKKY